MSISLNPRPDGPSLSDDVPEIPAELYDSILQSMRPHFVDGTDKVLVPNAITRKVCIFRKSTIAQNLAVMRIQGFPV